MSLAQPDEEAHFIIGHAALADFLLVGGTKERGEGQAGFFSLVLESEPEGCGDFGGDLLSDDGAREHGDETAWPSWRHGGYACLFEQLMECGVSFSGDFEQMRMSFAIFYIFVVLLRGHFYFCPSSCLRGKRGHRARIVRGFLLEACVRHCRR